MNVAISRRDDRLHHAHADRFAALQTEGGFGGGIELDNYSMMIESSDDYRIAHVRLSEPSGLFSLLPSATAFRTVFKQCARESA